MSAMTTPIRETLAARTPTPVARGYHALTFATCSVALVLQFLTTPPRPIATSLRLSRLVEYFTVDSLVVVCISTGLLAADAWADRAFVRRLRFVGVTSMAVLTIVYATLIHQGPGAQNTSAFGIHALPHYVIPVMVILGWFAFGPTGWVDRQAAALSVLFPVAWTTVALTRGAVTGYYPYRFMDVEAIGLPRACVNLAGVFTLVVATTLIGVRLDRRRQARRVAGSKTSERRTIANNTSAEPMIKAGR
jgi:hypothetical protein